MAFGVHIIGAAAGRLVKRSQLSTGRRRRSFAVVTRCKFRSSSVWHRSCTVSADLAWGCDGLVVLLQGLFSQPQAETNAAQPHLLHSQLTTAAMLYTAPQAATVREIAGEGQLPQMHRASSAAAELGLARQNSTAAQSQGDEDPAAKAEALNSASSGYMVRTPSSQQPHAEQDRPSSAISGPAGASSVRCQAHPPKDGCACLVAAEQCRRHALRLVAVQAPMRLLRL